MILLKQNGRLIVLTMLSFLCVLFHLGISVSTGPVVDFYFKTLSGNTQVNVSDLKLLKYPSKSDLERFGEKITALLS